MRRLAQAAPIAAAALPAPLAAQIQSVLAAGGEEAGRVAWLSWVLFGGSVVLVLLVMGVLWLAIGGSPRIRAAIAGRRTIALGGIALPLVVLTLLLAYGVWLMRDGVRASPAPDALRIEVTGEQWWWRVAYEGPGGAPVATANEIRIPVGRVIDFQLRAADVIHSFWVPSLAGKVDMIPGRTTRLKLRASEPGIYRGQCAEYCGGPHALMAFHVVAVPADGFERWLAAEALPAGAPAAPAAAAGARLFLAAGCGGCHTIRGTAATGLIGPDLTHVGSRHFIAAGTLRTTEANLVRFVTDNQHVKPGNRMPPFRIFTEAEAAAVAAYLAGLR